MAKYLRIASDLHLEGFHGRDEETLAIDFIPADDRDSESILVLPGDISSVPDQLIRFLSACLKRFSDVIFVPGNHEYYRHNFTAWNQTMAERFTLLAQEVAADGKHLYFSTEGIESVDIGGVRFIFGTMWGDGGPTLQDQGKTGFYLNDFRLITMPGHGDPNYRQIPRKFTVSDMMEQYRVSRRMIENQLTTYFDGKKIVITHHLPSRRLVSPRFWPSDGSDGANGGFVGDCDLLLARTEDAPAIWIHGHTHDTVDTELWNTRVVCNPAGYRGEWISPHNSFMQVNDLGVRITVPKFIEL